MTELMSVAHRRQRAQAKALYSHAVKLERGLEKAGGRRPSASSWLREAYTAASAAARYLDMEATMGLEPAAAAVEDLWAETAEKEVRDVMKKLRPTDRGFHAPVHPIKASTIDGSVQSSWLYPYRDRPWAEPSPFLVYVLTESGNLRDPYEYGLTGYFDKVAAAIKKDPNYEDAGWENYNAAVSYFWLKPKVVG